MEEMKGQAKAVGTEMIQDHIGKVDLKKNHFKHLEIVVKYTLQIALLYQLALRLDGLT